MLHRLLSLLLLLRCKQMLILVRHMLTTWCLNEDYVFLEGENFTVITLATVQRHHRISTVTSVLVILHRNHRLPCVPEAFDVQVVHRVGGELDRSTPFTKSVPLFLPLGNVFFVDLIRLCLLIISLFSGILVCSLGSALLILFSCVFLLLN